MLDFTASDHSTKFPPVSSVATPTASANHPVVGSDVPDAPEFDDDFDIGDYYDLGALDFDVDFDEPDETITAPTESSRMTWVN